MREPPRVLVVDDNRDAADTMAALLQQLGFRARTAYDARSALEALRASMPDAAFLDIGLPDLDGYELARRLRAMPETAHAVFVAVTGYGQPGDRERAQQAGFDHHLVKPVDYDALFGLIEQGAGAGKPGRDHHLLEKKIRD